MTIARSLALGIAGLVSVAACRVYVREPYQAYQPAPAAQPAPRPAPPPQPSRPLPPQSQAPEPPASTLPPPPPPRARARRTVAPPTATAAITSTEQPASTETEISPSTLPPRASPSTAPPAAAAPPVACLDAAAAPVGDCNAIKPPDASCHHVSSAAQKCNSYKTYLDAKVAALAVSCVTSLTSKQVCDGSQPLLCAKAALAQACPDPSVVQLCRIAATSCKITPGECSALLSGLNEGGQEAIAQCVAQGCPAGLGGCIDALAERAP
jgi:hypothetical protein